MGAFSDEFQHYLDKGSKPATTIHGYYTIREIVQCQHILANIENLVETGLTTYYNVGLLGLAKGLLWEEAMHQENQERFSEERFLIESAMAEVYAANSGLGNVDAAESKLLGVLELEPDLAEWVEALNLLAQLCAQTARHREALDHFAAALGADPSAAATLSECLAGMFEKQEEWELAIEVYTRALAHGENAILHNGVGYCLARANRLKEAEYHYRRATELAADTAAYANDLGYLLMEQGRPEEARALFGRALHLDPSFELAQQNLRICPEEDSEPR